MTDRTDNTRSATNRFSQADADSGQAVDERDALATQGRRAAGMAALANGRDAPDLNDETAIELGRRVSNQRANQTTRGAMRSRVKQMRASNMRGLTGPGRSHNGERDYWQTFGYPEPGTVTPEDKERRAKHQDIAKTIAEAPVETTWKHTPIIRDDGREEDADPTQFERDVQKLLDGTIASLTEDSGVERAGLDTYWEWADRKQRPVQYGLLFLGYDDGRAMDQPVNAGALDGPGDLAYANAFSQADVSDWWLRGDGIFESKAETEEEDTDFAGLVGDVQRPDKPIMYEVQFEESNPDGTYSYEERLVHHTRVQHIIEKPGRSEYLGTGCFDALYPCLIDFEKTTGAAAEAHYANVDRKYIGKGSQEGQLGQDRTDTIEQFDEQMYELLNDMRSTAYTENMDLEVVGGESVDPSGLLDSLYPFVSAVTGMPQRIMKGSERGDLASTQDDANWFSNMRERQTQTAEPRFVRATLNDLITYGVVTEPDHPENSYTVEWPSLWELTEIEQAQQAETRAHAIERIENAIALGADRDAMYSWVGIPLPDDDGQTGSGSTTGADPATNVDEESPEVRDQFGRITDNDNDNSESEAQAVADGGHNG